MEKDLYELLEVRPDVDAQEIKKAYRKKALKCHPDKNPDNPHAATLFLELSVAIEILLGEKSRPVYDKLYKARKAAVIRNNLLDERRKKFKSDLEERERQAQAKSEAASKSSYRDTLSEIDRLRKEGSRHLLEEMNKLNKEVAEKEERLLNVLRQSNTSESVNAKVVKPIRIKLKWENNENKLSYDEESLKKIFAKYGNVDYLIMNKKKKNSAIIELSQPIEASFVIKLECGFAENPLKVDIIGEPDQPTFREMPTCRPNLFPSMGESSQQPVSSFPDMDSNHSDIPSSTSETTEDIDYEERILNRLREFEHNKRAREAST